MAARTYTSFEDHPDEICWNNCDIDECPKYHPATGDVIPRRFEFWVQADRRGTLDSFGYMEHLIEAVVDLNADEPFGRREAFVKDLKTRAKLDVTVFLKKYARP